MVSGSRLFIDGRGAEGAADELNGDLVRFLESLDGRHATRRLAGSTTEFGSLIVSGKDNGAGCSVRRGPDGGDVVFGRVLASMAVLGQRGDQRIEVFVIDAGLVTESMLDGEGEGNDEVESASLFEE